MMCCVGDPGGFHLWDVVFLSRMMAAMQKSHQLVQVRLRVTQAIVSQLHHSCNVHHLFNPYKLYMLILSSVSEANAV